MAQHTVEILRKGLLSPLENLLQSSDGGVMYTLIDQLGYSNRTVTYTLTEHACKYPYLHYQIKSKAKAKHDLTLWC